MDTLLSKSKIKPHPFSTKVGDMIKRATDCSLNKEDWTLFLAISDEVNSSEETCKEGFKAIKQRLSSSIGRSQETLWLTLILIEMMVKNGNITLHLMVLNKEFLIDLNKILLPKSQAPVSHQNKVLQMFEDWIKTLAGVPGYKDLYKIYKSLKDKRIYVLANENAEMKENSIIGDDPAFARSSIFKRKPSNDIFKLDSSFGGGQGCVLCNSIKNAKTKLTSELDLVIENHSILNEMIHEIHPVSLEISEAKLMGVLYRTCQEMFKRLTELVGRPGLWEDTTERLLELIDSMNQTFTAYEDYLKRVNWENEVGQLLLKDDLLCFINEDLANVMTCEDFDNGSATDKKLYAESIY